MWQLEPRPRSSRQVMTGQTSVRTARTTSEGGALTTPKSRRSPKAISGMEKKVMVDTEVAKKRGTFDRCARASESAAQHPFARSMPASGADQAGPSGREDWQDAERRIYCARAGACGRRMFSMTVGQSRYFLGKGARRGPGGALNASDSLSRREEYGTASAGGVPRLRDLS